MNDKDLIKVYKDLKNSEAPDLWNRIEASLDTASLAEEVNGNTQEQPSVTARPNKILPLKNYNKFVFSSAAVILVVLVATAVIGLPLLRGNKSAENIKVFKSHDEASPAQEADSKYDSLTDYSVLPTVTAPITTPAPTCTTADEPLKREEAAMPKTYSELKLADIQPVRLPTVTAPQSPQTRYFTTEAFADTDLLIQATVLSINFIYNDKSEAHSVVYTVSADNVYYSGREYPTVGRDADGCDMLTVISPIIQADDVWMYPLLVNRTYLLPLTVTDSDAINLVFPYAPQIELTLDGFCVFHSGWQALINDNTGILLVDCVHPDDYFYDRMLVRPTNGLTNDLTRLIKSLKN